MAEGTAPIEQADPVHVAQENERSVEGMSCFVIMPYGVKKDPHGDSVFDFDRVYRELIQPAAHSLGLKCVRSDEVNQAGLIHREMIDHIINSDLCIVDITTGNPNVMYELGVRHAAWKSGTIIIRRRNSHIPFNIAGMRAMDYDVGGTEGDAASASLAQQRELLKTNIRNSLLVRNVDSLVHTIVPGLNVARRPKPIAAREIRRFCECNDTRKAIEIITGDIANIDTVDVWVNPENTRMELGRLHDSSVSAIIRYFGARKDARGQVTDDTITRLLRDKLGRKYWAGVEPGTVVWTEAGELKQDNNVRALLHVAAQHGEPTLGYSPIRGYVRCLTAALNEIDSLNGEHAAFRKTPLKSVLFPLFGTRSSGFDPQDMTYDLVRGAAEYLRTWPGTKIERIAFLAYTDADLALCQTAVQRNGLSSLKPSL
jgi:O-acetyl-ADP-ribose deacetylase (regulator of RNase III)